MVQNGAFSLYPHPSSLRSATFPKGEGSPCPARLFLQAAFHGASFCLHTGGYLHAFPFGEGVAAATDEVVPSLAQTLYRAVNRSAHRRKPVVNLCICETNHL